MATAGVVGFDYPLNIPYSMMLDGSTDYTIWTPGDSGDQKIWTFSFWVKRGNITSQQCIFCSFDTVDGDSIRIEFTAADKLRVYATGYAAGNFDYLTTALYRDPTNWYHFVIALDAANTQLRIWENGVLISAFDTSVAPTNQNYDVNNAMPKTIGRDDVGNDNYFDGYLAKVISIDGTEYTMDDFGESYRGVWVAKSSLSLTYETYGFKQDYSNAGDLGEDSSGNNNDFTVNGTPAQVIDTPTNNHCVISPLSLSPGTLSNGNTTISGAENGEGTFFVSQGKWAWKVTSAENGNYGIISDDLARTQYVAADVSGEVIEFELDLTGMTLKKRVDGGGLETVQDPIASGKMWSPHFESAATVDFGASGFTPTDSDYLTLNSANIAAQEQNTILDEIDQPREAIYVNTREGTGAEATISDVLFDVSAGSLVINKNMDAAGDPADEWKWTDTLRGATEHLSSDKNAIEAAEAQGVKSFTATGYVLGTSDGYNTNGETFLDMALREGAAFGFDIVIYEGTGSAHNVSHGLGRVPTLIIVKNRDQADSWYVYHVFGNAVPEDYSAQLDTTAGFADDATGWNDTAPTASVFTVNTNGAVNAIGENYVAYVLTDIPGLCKAFVYLGSNDTIGPYVPLGFRPAYFFSKSTGAAVNWNVFDEKRVGHNVENDQLFFSSPSAQATGDSLDILSQGFKPRSVIVNTAVAHVGFAWAHQFGAYSNSR